MKVGKNTYISPSAVIKGDNIVIGDNCYIGDGVQILVDDFTLGDYCKIHNKSTLHGYDKMTIGHNAWIGQGTIIDSIGGVSIGDNCGIGAYSQLWSHIRYGDPMEGCNYESKSKLSVGKDVWFVGHCIVSPVTVEDKAMALVGSVVTKDMKENHIYGGSPAKDLTEKIKPQFRPVTLEEKWSFVKSLDVPDFVEFVDSYDLEMDERKTYFNISDRTYTKRMTEGEQDFMKYLLGKLIKFTPS
jgi:acetyltransferase-like isoleucine patch superfamily enzyme